MITDQDAEKIVDRVAERFSPLFNMLTGAIHELRLEIYDVRSITNSLVTAMDSQVKILEDLRIEYLSMRNRLSRHDRWIEELAKNTGTELSIEL